MTYTGLLEQFRTTQRSAHLSLTVYI